MVKVECALLLDCCDMGRWDADEGGRLADVGGRVETRIEFGKLATSLASPWLPGVRGRWAEGRGPSLTFGLKGGYPTYGLTRSGSKADGRVDWLERRESRLGL